MRRRRLRPSNSPRSRSDSSIDTAGTRPRPAIASPPHIPNSFNITNLAIRTLGDCGIIYARLVDDVRRQLSDRYLADVKLSLGEVAYLLGYSECSAFNRAYRRWTGRTPSAARRSAAA